MVRKGPYREGVVVLVCRLQVVLLYAMSASPHVDMCHDTRVPPLTWTCAMHAAHMHPYI